MIRHLIGAAASLALAPVRRVLPSPPPVQTVLTRPSPARSPVNAAASGLLSSAASAAGGPWRQVHDVEPTSKKVDTAAVTAAQSRVNSAAQKMDGSVAHLRAAATKNKKLARKVSAIADALSKKSAAMKSRAAQLQASRSKM